jgi:cell division septal protein FtsQ
MILGVFYLYDYLTTCDGLAVSQIHIEGTNRLSVGEVNRLIADIEGQNILLVSLDDYQKRFTDHPRISSVALKRVLPNKVICTVGERTPVVLLYTDRFLEVDEQGMVMPADDLTPLLDLPVITGVSGRTIKEGKRLEHASILSALDALRVCKKQGGNFADDISELRISDLGISIVSLEQGLVLLLGDSDIDKRLKKFFLMRTTIVERGESAGLIDLRFDDQIVLRAGI